MTRARPKVLVRAALTAMLLAAVLAVGQGPAVAATSNRRVDLATPTFSRPTSITNPLFPISKVTHVLQLGAEAGVPLRHEITLLGETRVIEWNGTRVETVVSQFLAYGDGRILEVALDYFAQADDGSVWYFGEDVANYEDGVVVNHDGTWLAGKDGPPGMIMQANPRVGDVYRPENIPGLVFEEVTVKAVNQTVAGPRGPVRGAIRVQERLIDGVLEDKVFAPGYGEFEARVASEDELVTVAVAVPTDVLGPKTPPALSELVDDAADVGKAAASSRWRGIPAGVRSMTRTWNAYRDRAGVPPLLGAQMDDALGALVDAVEAHEPAGATQAAIAVAHAGLDLQLQFRSVESVDEARLGVWRRQLKLDRATGDEAGVAGDRVVIDAIEDRDPGDVSLR